MATNKCYGCGRPITANQQSETEHNKLFHPKCLERFLTTDEGREWDLNYRRSKEGQIDQVNNFLEKIRKKGISYESEEYKKIQDDLLNFIHGEEEYDNFLEKLHNAEEQLSDIIKFRQKKKRVEEFIKNVNLYNDKYKDVSEYSQIYNEIQSSMPDESDDTYNTFYEKLDDYENQFYKVITLLNFKYDQLTQIDDLVQQLDRYKFCSNNQKLEQIREELMSSVAKYGDDEGYQNYLEKFHNYQKQLQDYVQEKNQQKEEYDKAFEDAFKKVDDAFLFVSDDEAAKKVLYSIKNKQSEANEAILQKIISLNLKEGSESNNGLILFGIMLIVNVVFAPIGIVLLIIGIKWKRKPDKDARYKYNLIKEIFNEAESNQGDIQ